MQFRDIIGQEELKRRLVASVAAGRVSHAQLFTGAAGAGTLPLAVAYAQYLNCRHRADGDSCGVCPDCRQIAALAHPDLHLVFPVNKQGKKSGEVITSDAFLPLFRTVFARSNGYFSPQEWYRRAQTWQDAARRDFGGRGRRDHPQAFVQEFRGGIQGDARLAAGDDERGGCNKILKILEEPWEKTVFLLVSEAPDRLLQTILSRTQEVAVPRISTEVLEAVAARHGQSDPARLHNLARLAGGDYLTLQRLLAGEDDELTRDCFGLFCSLMRLSYNDKHLELVSWAEEVAHLSREQQRVFLRHAARLLRESYMLHAGLADISYLWGAEADFCGKFAPFIGNENVEFLLDEIERAMRQITQNGNPTIVFTHFALSVSKQIRRK